MAKAATAMRYAQALFAIAGEKNATEAWLDELNQAQAALDDPTVRAYLDTPRVRTEEKLGVVTQLLEGREPMVASMVGLLTERHASSSLRAVIDAYGELLNQQLGRVKAEVTTATPMSSEQQQKLSAALGTSLGKAIVLDAQEDPEIIGGIVVRVGDQIIDGSVRSKLAAMKQRLERGSLT
ncbi:MAG: F0F1 ATP synthase subunit delta [Chloroflexi bacterium]|nr:F0F1 ATP synthase subunit delta [Chloroflexota bacterium]